MLRILISILFIITSSTISAQVQISGRVMDLQNVPISNVIVKVMKGGQTLQFTTTDLKGTYRMELKQTLPESAMLLFSHILHLSVVTITH